MRILFFILLLMFGCDNPLEQDVTDLENRITQLEDELALVDSLNTVMMDSLVTSLLNQDLLIDSLYISQDSYIDSLNTDQQAYIDSLNADMQAYIDLLDTTQDTYIDSLYTDMQTYIDSQQAYIDSLNTAQQAYIDSLYNEQQIMLENLASTALNAGFVETEVYSGAVPMSWTDLDISSVIGQEESLVLLKHTHISSSSAGIMTVRTNGSDDGFSEQSLGNCYLSINSTTGFTFILSDNNGLIEHRISQDNNLNVTTSVVFYLNQ